MMFYHMNGRRMLFAPPKAHTTGRADMTDDTDVTAALARVRGMASAARAAQSRLARATTAEKDGLLNAIADALVDSADAIGRANAEDYAIAQDGGMSAGLLDRLKFDSQRIASTAQGVRNVAALPDPVGRVVRGNNLPNGIRLTQVRVPMGVVGMIYEARPNVTIDVAALCLKSGNAAILRGGHAAFHTNEAILSVVAQALAAQGFDPALVQSVDRIGRPGATAMMQARGSIDVLVPRGGAGLIKAVVENSKVPTIETGSGNCHIYVDKAADLGKVVPILINAKTQRVGVCNAAEKLLVHADVAAKVLPTAAEALRDHHVLMHADDRTRRILDEAGLMGADVVPATDEDWDTEYLDYQIGIKVVDGIDEAIRHIGAHSTGHTEAILSEDYAAIEEFTARVDSAVVMVNASTRFTDGGMFGLGAELGISTQKLHARGPMGLEELTTTKWIAYGSGQVRQ